LKVGRRERHILFSLDGIGYLKISAPVLFDVRKNAVSFLNKNAGLFSGGAKP